MLRTNTLQNQPIDILLSISQLLDHEFLLCLRLVSRSLNHTVTPYALRHIGIFLQHKWGETEGNIAKRLYGFKDNPKLVQTLACHAHRLKIRLHEHYFGGEDHIPKDAIDPICEGLRQFKSVKSLDLKCIGQKNLVFMKNLQDKLCLSILEATGYSLEELTLSPNKPRLSIPMFFVESSLGLRSLRISHDKSGLRCQDPNRNGSVVSPLLDQDTIECPVEDCDPLPLTAIQKFVQKNPLEKLQILHGCMVKGFEPEYIFPPRDEQSPLTSLSIKGFNPTSLTSLIPANSLCNLAHLAALNRASHFKLDKLWLSLKAARTQLQTLATCQVSHSLCVYLASYRGLRELSITEIEHDADSTSEKTLSAFFDNVLPQHGKTLSKLKVGYSPLVEGENVHDAGWALSGKHNGRWGRTLSNLTALTSLHIEPRFILDLDDMWDFSHHWPTTAPLIQEYQTALDYIAEVAPQIDTLEFLWRDMKFRLGQGKLAWIFRCGEIICEAGEALDRQSRGPEGLILNNGTYRLAFDQDKGMFVYRRYV